MTDITVVKHLFILGIISIILNTLFLTAFLTGYISIVVLYGINSRSNDLNEAFSAFAAAVETIGILAFFLTSTLTLVGSSLVIMSDKKKRVAGIVVTIIGICILVIHIITNVILLIINFAYGRGQLLTINGYILIPTVLFQFSLLIYNSIFVSIAGYSLRKEQKLNNFC